MDEELLPIITNLLSEQIKDPDLSPDEPLLDTGKLTSLTSMNLLVAIEDHFQIRIPNSELNRKNFSTLRSIAQMVSNIKNH